MRGRMLMFALLVAIQPLQSVAQELHLPNKDGSVKFAVIGDTGTGDSHQKEVANELLTVHAKFPYAFVVMMGDNLYTGDREKDYQKAFQTPYKPLLDAGVKF